MFQCFKCFKPLFHKAEKVAEDLKIIYIIIYIIFNILIYKYIIHPLLPPKIKPQNPKETLKHLKQ